MGYQIKNKLAFGVFSYAAFWLLQLLFCKAVVYGQTLGCNDPQANNFVQNATANDGSCVYGNAFYNPGTVIQLPAALPELSGMVYWNGLLWGHNDGGNGAWLYAIDTLTGSVRKVIGLQNATNRDWEDIAQDSAFFYIGDFGNNANGNRTNLSVYKIPKALVWAEGDTVLLTTAQYSQIRFSYPDQTDFSPTGANKTRFDCEAMFFNGGRLHLITKNWIGNYSVHYSLSTEEGTHIAQRHDSLKTDGFLITGADLGAVDEILLTAYNTSGSCVIFLMYGFTDATRFFETGNKRKINLPSSLTIGQLEAACFVNGIRGFIGSERFSVAGITVPQNLRKFTTDQWVTDHYRHNSRIFAEPGMLRYNASLDCFEYYNGEMWILLGDN